MDKMSIDTQYKGITTNCPNSKNQYGVKTTKCRLDQTQYRQNDNLSLCQTSQIKKREVSDFSLFVVYHD